MPTLDRIRVTISSRCNARFLDGPGGMTKFPAAARTRPLGQRISES
ncbi:MAG TPA: hypothetical protein VIT00_03685 [Terrimicrobiaceae bacterium]